MSSTLINVLHHLAAIPPLYIWRDTLVLKMVANMGANRGNGILYLNKVKRFGVLYNFGFHSKLLNSIIITRFPLTYSIPYSSLFISDKIDFFVYNILASSVNSHVSFELIVNDMFPTYLRCFTDGSKSPNYAGAGFCIPSLELSKSCRFIQANKIGLYYTIILCLFNCKIL